MTFRKLEKRFNESIDSHLLRTLAFRFCETYVSELGSYDIHKLASQSSELPYKPCGTLSFRTDLAKLVVQVPLIWINLGSLDQ